MDYADFSFRSHFLHAYLISGPAEAEKLLFAKKLAAAMVCRSAEHPCGICRDCRKAAADIHPDIITVEAEDGKRGLTVGQARFVRQDAAVLPNEADRKVYILPHADEMNDQAQNALLKTLEEPPAYACFLLIAENPQRLLETVRSRCAEIVVPPTQTDECSAEAEEFLRTLTADDKLKLAEAILSLEKLDKEQTASLIDAVRTRAGQLLRQADCRQDKLTAAICAMDEADRYMDANINNGTIAGLLMARFL